MLFKNRVEKDFNKLPNIAYLLSDLALSGLYSFPEVFIRFLLSNGDYWYGVVDIVIELYESKYKIQVSNHIYKKLRVCSFIRYIHVQLKNSMPRRNVSS